MWSTQHHFDSTDVSFCDFFVVVCVLCELIIAKYSVIYKSSDKGEYYFFFLLFMCLKLKQIKKDCLQVLSSSWVLVLVSSQPLFIEVYTRNIHTNLSK